MNQRATHTPELLEACKELREGCAALMRCCAMYSDTDTAIQAWAAHCTALGIEGFGERADAAIARAEGVEVQA